jgi:hypothetical protein
MDGLVRAVGDGITGLVGGSIAAIGDALGGMVAALGSALPPGALPIIGVVVAFVFLWLMIRR